MYVFIMECDYFNYFFFTTTYFQYVINQPESGIGLNAAHHPNAILDCGFIIPSHGGTVIRALYQMATEESGHHVVTFSSQSGCAKRANTAKIINVQIAD